VNGRTILYALNGKTKRAGNAEVNSLKIRGSSLNSNSNEKLTKNSEDVKEKFSFNQIT